MGPVLRTQPTRSATGVQNAERDLRGAPLPMLLCNHYGILARMTSPNGWTPLAPPRRLRPTKPCAALRLCARRSVNVPRPPILKSRFLHRGVTSTQGIGDLVAFPVAFVRSANGMRP